MKAEILISLISAVSLHAGLFCIGGGHRDLPASATEIEIGLEAGDSALSNASTEETGPACEEPANEVVEQSDPLPPEPEPVTQPPAPPVPEAPKEMPAEQVPPHAEEPPQTSPGVAEEPPAPVAPKPVAVVKKVSKSGSTRSSKTSGMASSAGSGHGSNISSARYRFRAPLRYPATAFAQHVGGTVVLTIEINASGRAVNASVKQSSGHRELDASAIQCAMASRYEPYRVNGQSEPCSVVAPFLFEAK